MTQAAPPPAARLRRFISASIIATVSFCAVAAYTTKGSDLYELMGRNVSEEESLSYIPTDDFSQEVEEHIRNHPVAIALRQNPAFSESRPHLRIPEAIRHHSLTAGTLTGPGKIVVPPYFWTEHGGKSMTSIFYLGADVSGHPGIVHGGLLATMLDEGLARCCFAALPNKVGMTANLNVNYRKPAPAGTFFVLKARTTKVEGRKAWVEGHIETLVGEGEEPVVLVEATALFIEPREIQVSVEDLAAALKQRY